MTVQNKVAMENDEVLRQEEVEVLKVILVTRTSALRTSKGILVRVKLAPHDVDLVANLSQGYPSKDPPTFKMTSLQGVDMMPCREFFELWRAADGNNGLFDSWRGSRGPR